MLRRFVRLLAVAAVVVTVFTVGAGLGAATRWDQLGRPSLTELLPSEWPHPPSLPRPPAPPPCASDHAVHAVYVIPAGAPDRGLHWDGSLRRSIAAQQEWLAGETDGRRLRFVCDGAEPAVAFVELDATARQVFAAHSAYDLIRAELHRRGFNRPTVIYAAYYDGDLPGICGVANSTYPAPVAVYTVWADAYCHSRPAASVHSPGTLEFGMTHEIFHALGAVPDCASHKAHDAHVTDDERDVLFSGRQRWAPARIDVGRDDYYGHGRPGCLDLADSIFWAPPSPGATTPPGWPPR